MERSTKKTLHMLLVLLLVAVPVCRGQQPQQQIPERLFSTAVTKKADSCTTHPNCTACNANDWCHWCGESKGCHVMGSVYGCARGMTCEKKKHSNTTDDSCFAHKTCADCSLASRLCHWCAHDEACHVVGSSSGCLRGVNCYDNDHCKREEPEALPDRKLQVTPIPVAIATVIAFIICCCSTCCCCAVSFVKGAYNDLVKDMTYAASHRNGENDRSDEHRPRTIVQELDDRIQQDEGEAVEEENASGETDSAEEETNSQEPATEVEENREAQPLLSNEAQQDTGYVLLQDDVEDRLRLPTRSIHRLYYSCVVCYLLSLITAGGLAYSTIKYFPQKPEFSVCSDSVAWKSIIDALIVTKVAAEFELLVSFSNPNPVSVDLDMCKGSFYYGDAFVGDFEIPSTIVAANSISDLLIVAKLHPERWVAVKIGTEFYEGSLKLNISADATVRIPLLMDYTFTTKVDGLEIEVNAVADRHLCACPTWSDARNHTIPPALPEFMEDLM